MRRGIRKGAGEVVDRIFAMEDGAVPNLYEIVRGDNNNAGNYSLKQAHPTSNRHGGGGKIDAVDGFGWRSERDRSR
jgi:hypothetical protein